MIPARLVGANGQQVAIDDSGAIIVATTFDLPKYQNMDLANTAYNFFKPYGDERFVITGFTLFADKQVSTTTNATVILYEASTEDSTTVDRVLYESEIGQNQVITMSGINVLTNKGVYVNGKTDDDDVHATLFGHYIKTNGKVREFPQ